MAEPERLLEGKRFEALVYEDFRCHNKNGVLRFERTRSLALGRTGRMDVLVDQLGDHVAIYEVKATDWDRIRPANVRRNALRHQRQLLRYVDTYVNIGTSVSLGIIYPTAPVTPGLRAVVENVLEEGGTPAYWFNEIAGGA